MQRRRNCAVWETHGIRIYAQSRETARHPTNLCNVETEQEHLESRQRALRSGAIDAPAKVEGDLRRRKSPAPVLGTQRNQSPTTSIPFPH